MTKFSEEEKALVQYFKEKLKSRGVNKFPRDWHLKQLSIARDMLSGTSAPTLEQWKHCVDWALSDQYWKDKIDHLARIFTLWPKFVLKGGLDIGRTAGHNRQAQGKAGCTKRSINGRDGQVPF